MGKQICTLSLDSFAVEECKRRGFALSTLLSKLLIEHLQMIDSPEGKREKAMQLAAEAVIKEREAEAAEALQAQIEANKPEEEKQAEAIKARVEGLKIEYPNATEEQALDLYRELRNMVPKPDKVEFGARYSFWKSKEGHEQQSTTS